MRKYFDYLNFFVFIFFYFFSFASLATPNQTNSSAIQFAFVIDEQQHFKNERIEGLKKNFWELQIRTSMIINIDPVVFTYTPQEKPSLESILSYPFIIWTSIDGLTSLSSEEKKKLREFLFLGGTIFFDNSYENEKPFSQALSLLFNDIAPSQNLFPLPKEHVLFKSFYLIGDFIGKNTSRWGRFDFSRQLLAIESEGRTNIFYSRNDLIGALTFSNDSNPLFLSRNDYQTIETSYRYFTNIIMYALCLDYKDDQVHIPFILKRRR